MAFVPIRGNTLEGSGGGKKGVENIRSFGEIASSSSTDGESVVVLKKSTEWRGAGIGVGGVNLTVGTDRKSVV